MIGLGIHNYNLPSNRFQFVLIPMYTYQQGNWMPWQVELFMVSDKNVYKLEAGIIGAFLSWSRWIVSARKFWGLLQACTFLKIIFNNKDPGDYEETWWIDARTYLIRKNNLIILSPQWFSFIHRISYAERYLNQLTIGVDNFRNLYPYEGNSRYSRELIFILGLVYQELFLQLFKRRWIQLPVVCC
jgi:hypothetical protein